MKVRFDWFDVPDDMTIAEICRRKAVNLVDFHEPNEMPVLWFHSALDSHTRLCFLSHLRSEAGDHHVGADLHPDTQADASNHR